MSAWAILCCGCNRFMMPDGKPGVSILTKDGMVDLKNLRMVGLQPTNLPASFPDRKASDRAARKFGWQVADSGGPNHRCPDCVKKAELLERTKAAYAGVIGQRGAYVEIPD